MYFRATPQTHQTIEHHNNHLLDDHRNHLKADRNMVGCLDSWMVPNLAQHLAKFRASPPN